MGSSVAPDTHPETHICVKEPSPRAGGRGGYPTPACFRLLTYDPGRRFGQGIERGREDDFSFNLKIWVCAHETALKKKEVWEKQPGLDVRPPVFQCGGRQEDTLVEGWGISKAPAPAPTAGGRGVPSAVGP